MRVQQNEPGGLGTEQSADRNASVYLWSQYYDCINSHFTDPGDLWLIICLFVCVFQQEENQEVASSPPESSFQKLAPSETRYTILRDRDEL